MTSKTLFETHDTEFNKNPTPPPLILLSCCVGLLQREFSEVRDICTMTILRKLLLLGEKQQREGKGEITELFIGVF